jgi:hypothetical protein
MLGQAGAWRVRGTGTPTARREQLQGLPGRMQVWEMAPMSWATELRKTETWMVVALPPLRPPPCRLRSCTGAVTSLQTSMAMALVPAKRAGRGALPSLRGGAVWAAYESCTTTSRETHVGQHISNHACRLFSAGDARCSCIVSMYALQASDVDFKTAGPAAFGQLTGRRCRHCDLH